MDSHQISAISTSVIAFMTIIGLMFGFYYNLRTTNTRILHIIIFEALFLVSVWLFILWIKRRGGI